MLSLWQRAGLVAVVLVGLLIWLAPLRGSREGGDVSRQELDKRLKNLLAETMAHGAELYNGGNREGCYQLYAGTLRTLKVVLDHQPALQKMIDEKLTKAKGMTNPVDRAFTLREALDECYNTLGKEEKSKTGKEAKGETKKSLWDRLGGEGGVRAVVHDAVDAAAKDPKVNFDRNGKYKITPEGVKDLEQKLVELVSSVSGGPLKYTGKDMKTVHKGMGITDEEFNALTGHVVSALQKHKVPEAEQKEVVGAIALTRSLIVESKK